MQVKTIFIVNGDLGFVFWLGRLLNEAGYQVWPARNGDDAAALMQELGAELDLLVIDPGLPGASRFIELQRARGDFRMIFVGRPEDFYRMPGSHTAPAKSSRPDGLSELEWITVVQNLMSPWQPSDN